MGCSHEVNKSFNVPPTKRFVRFTFITLLLFSLSIGAFRGYARSAKSVQYLDVTKEAGITFKHVNGRAGKRYMVETMGTGAAFLDYNNDGYLDIYFVNSAALPGGTYDVKPTNVLYRNNGDGTFIDVSLIASVGDTGYGSGCCVGDYDNDGYNDLYVTNFGTNVLYHNNGDGAFVDVTDRAGVGGGDKWSAGCAFLDYDSDGDLDLYVANYASFDFEIEKHRQYFVKGFPVYAAPENFDGLSDTLYRNNGDGTFSDVSLIAGIEGNAARGLGVVCGDYDNDGDVDIFVANDADENFLYRNDGVRRPQQDVTFTSIASLAGVGLSEDGVAENGMGTSMGDYDNDGLLDIVVTNFQGQTCSIYHNEGDGLFLEVSFLCGIGEKTFNDLSWGTAFFDSDNDGHQDVFIANGHVHDNIELFDGVGTFAQQNRLLKNNGDGTFVDVSQTSGSGLQIKQVSRGTAFGDYDNDGDVDILVVNSNQPPSLLENVGGNQNNWLMFHPISTSCEPSHPDWVCSSSRIGTRIIVTSNQLKQIREVKSGGSYLSQNDLRLHFGLGTATKADVVEIRWPNGQIETFKDVDANQALIVKEGSGLKRRF
ncbi:MAG TPA: CRTAC1 family protein [Rhodospirillales bacterium]|nr:CRTAC1 family protein [Rhodospirillales bacterium]